MEKMRESLQHEEMTAPTRAAAEKVRIALAGRSLNASLMLDHLRRNGPKSRVEITDALQLSRSTVTEITGELLDEGIIEVLEDEEPSAETRRGRPRVLLRLNPEASYAVGVRVGLSQITISVTDFLCHIVHSSTMHFRIARQEPKVVVDLIEDTIRRAVAESGISLHRVSGVCVGVPGMVDANTGVCHWSLAFQRSPIPLGDLLANSLGLPVLVETHTVPLATAEFEFGSAGGADAAAILTLGHGVGVGLIINGAVYRGGHGFASEFSHTKISLDGRQCECGQHGCLQAYIGITALLETATPYMAEPISDDPGIRENQLADLIRKADEGHTELQSIFRGIGPHLGRALSNLCLIMDPSEIILTGPVLLQAGHYWLAPMQETLLDNIQAPMRDRLKIKTHDRDDTFWARGAAALVLRQFYDLRLQRQRRYTGLAAVE